MGSDQSKNNSQIDDSSSNNSNSEDSDEFQSVGSTASDMEITENISQLTSDAAFTTTKTIFHYPTKDEIDQLDHTILDYNDKISFIYLLYDNPNKALEMLGSSFEDVVKDWVRIEGKYIEKWHMKLLEALCIIKHFKALKFLGCNKTEAVSTFLSFNKLIYFKVNKIRKFLYCVFEDLHPYQVDKLFIMLQKDLTRLSINAILDKTNLEYTFLQLEKSGYFSQIDLTNLIKLFKETDLLSQSEDLKSLQENINISNHHQITLPVASAAAVNWIPSSNSSFLKDDVTQHHEFLTDRRDDFRNIDEIQSKISDQQSMANKGIHNMGDCYHVDPSKPGLLLIIDNENFYTEGRQEYKHLLPKLCKKLDNRLGTKVDKEKLEEVFEKLNFVVVVRSDVIHDKLKQHIKHCIKTVEENNYSCFFVAILSHGDKGVIYGSNTIPIDIAEIQETLYASALSGKPKILLIQACQGENLQRIDDEYATDGPESSTSKLTSPRTADVLVFYATIPNYTAIRHLKNGTWFIQSLCEKMESSENDHFEEICIKVSQDVVSKRWGNVIMVPLRESSLTKKLYLTSKVTNKSKFNFNVESQC